MGVFDENDNPTKGQKEKAVRLVEQGKVRRLKLDGFVVEGDSGTYITIVFADDEEFPHFCSCERTKICSHMLAAMLTNQLTPPSYITVERKKYVHKG